MAPGKKLLKNNKMKKKKPNFFTKKFFSRTFNLPENKVGQWGILKNEGKLSPCLMLRKEQNVIDLLAGEFKTCKDLSWTKTFAEPAQISREKNEIIFTAKIKGEEVSVKLNKSYWKKYIPAAHTCRV